MQPSNDGSKSTWRQRDITIPGGDEFIFDFPDTRPNHFYINNLSENVLYGGINTLPSKEVHEVSVDAFGTDILAQQTGVTRFTLYNSGGVPARVILTTFEDTFNPATLTRKGASGSGGGGGGGDAFDGIIRGFQTALPPGINNIGKVVVTDMPAQNIKFDTLPPGTNKIGTVDVAKLPPLPAGNSKIGTVGIEGGLTITSMPAVTLNGDVTLEDTSFSIKGERQYYSHNGTVGTSETVLNLPIEISGIRFITNDGTTDLLIAFNTETTTGTQSGLNAVIVLKAGESISDLNIKATVVKLRRASGSGQVRLMGV